MQQNQLGRKQYLAQNRKVSFLIFLSADRGTAIPRCNVGSLHWTATPLYVRTRSSTMKVFPYVFPHVNLRSDVDKQMYTDHDSERMVLTVKPVQLNPKTLEAFDAYIHNAETEMEHSLHGSGSFLWSQQIPERAHLVDQGQVVAQFWSGEGPVRVPNGLIHDWIAAGFIRDSNIQELLAVMQQYDKHKDTYKPEVMDSKLISRHGNDFQVYLRLLKKKIITVVLDTDHDVHYRPVGRTRWVCHSYTTRIAEVESAGSRSERILQPDTGYGFLWRLSSYWRIEECDAGAVIECRAISLTRDVPFGLGWAIEPIIQKLPKESLINTLEATRRALHT